MEDRNVCRLCKKIEISTDTYFLKTIGYINDAKFDENDNLILIDKKNGVKTKRKISSCLNEKFLKSSKSICYADDVDYAYLNELYEKTDLEELFTEYVKDCELYNSIVYFDKGLGVFQMLKFKASELANFEEFIYLKDLVSQYGEGLHQVFMSNDSAIFDIGLYNKIKEFINNEDYDNLRHIFTTVDGQLRLYTQQGVPSEYSCNLIQKDKLKTKNQIEKTEEEIIEDLNSLVGLDKIKLAIQELKNYLKFDGKTKDFLELDRSDLNMVFTGTPGTGKTTVAKILAALLNKMGLANDKIFECTAKDFIGGYVGQTAIKTNELMKKAKGGILFIDEAYSFVSQGNSYAQEAISEILKEIEKEETIFIFSGYKKEMEVFIKSNPGLTSRIGYYFDFENYNVLQLYEIFEKKLAKTKMVMSEDCKPIIIDLIDQATKSENFGNGRFIDKLFDSIIKSHANNTINTDEKEKLITITKDDIKENILEQILYTDIQEKRIGFHN